MCGITGYYQKSYKRDLATHLKRALDTISHRGPDSDGIYQKENIGLGHRRLSIVDLTPTGNQPMYSSNKNFIIVFNGEIYNYLELKKELIQEGYSFVGTSDTEVVVNGFERWGVGLFKKLNGIFALAIYNILKDELVLAKDRFGVKPLYFFNDNNSIIFGSEIKTILEFNVVTKELNYEGFHEFLYFGYGLGKNTLFRNIYKLLPSQYLCIDKKSMTIGSFWQHEEIRPSTLNEKESIELTRTLLEEAVKRQLISDVPVGVFLSGGIDSSAITAYASKHYKSKLNTYSAGFDFDGGHNELPLAAKVAKKFNTNHHELMIYGGSLEETIKTLILHHDEPFSDAANIPLYLMTKEVKNECKVILQGDGGDEFFGGYQRYQIMKNYSLYKTICYTGNLTNAINPFKYIKEKIERFSPLFLEENDGKAFARLLTLESDLKNTVSEVLSTKFKVIISKSDPFFRYKEITNRFSYLTDKTQKLLYTDSCIILPDQFLEKVDKSTMANGVEVRVPFLDYNLTNFALSIPTNIKLKNGRKKYLLKKALDGLVPDEVLYGPKKGFGVPYQNWIKGPLKPFMLSVINSEEIQKLNIFDHNSLNNKVIEHCNGTKNNGFMLWKVLNFCLWVTMYDIQIGEK